MDYSLFINQKIINKYNEEGIVLSFDENSLLIQYENVTKTYNPKLTFKNKFISFVNPDLNKIIDDDINRKIELENKEKEEIEKNNQEAIQNNIDLTIEYEFLLSKNKVMQYLFGNDFNYPPYIEFKKKYKELFRDRYPYYFYNDKYW